MKSKNHLSLALLALGLGGVLTAQAQESGADSGNTEGSASNDNERGFAPASIDFFEKLDASRAELNALREELKDEMLELHSELSGLEAELQGLDKEFNERKRERDNRNIEVSKLKKDLEQREADNTYLAGWFEDYSDEFASRLHVAEEDRWGDVLEKAGLAGENSNLTDGAYFTAQVELVNTSLDRLYDLIGGTRFQGSAETGSSVLAQGTFAMAGPLVLFRSNDGADVGVAERRTGSIKPVLLPFGNPEDEAAAAALVANGSGLFPLDASQGDALKIEATKESLLEHVQKGGPVMVPIFAMAALALLVALYKWASLSMLRKPSKKRVDLLLDSIGEHDQEAVRASAAAVQGPAGEMLAIGVDHLDEPRELIEEVMYEKVLRTRLKTQRFLPFIAICASSAPLLGLLGTVTGIINTFKIITLFGSGDVKSLSGGISEALITTKFGLIVAIPSLLLHAFLSRKAKGVVDQMETTAVAFANEVEKANPRSNAPARVQQIVTAEGSAAPDEALVRAQVNEILNDLLVPLAGGHHGNEPASTRSRESV